MFDRNGLQLTTANRETLNTYRLTAVDLDAKKYAAYALADRKHNKEWTMFIICYCKDPRDAAFIAQEFEKHYTKAQIRQMVIDRIFKEVASAFCDSLEIPEWSYAAEGLMIEELVNDYGYKVNYVDCPRLALVEAISVFKLKTPDTKTAKTMIEQVKALYELGKTYREAAKLVLQQL